MRWKIGKTKEKMSFVLSERMIDVFVILIFVFSVLLYGYVAKERTFTTLAYIDEALYIAQAKSFFHEFNFIRGNQALGYDTILYPIFLSLGYCFFKPDTILTVFRCMGVVAMSSAVFPIYRMVKMNCGDKKKAILVCLFSIFVPEMLYSSWILQEVLLYPLCIWLFYFLQKEICNGYSMGNNILIGILLAACAATKTLGAVFACAYVGLIIFRMLKAKCIRSEIRYVVALLIFVLGKILCSELLVVLNGREGITHYSNQMAVIKEFFCWEGLSGFVRGFLYYYGWSAFALGIVTVIIPLLSYKNYSEKDKELLFYTFVTYLGLLLLSVVTVFMTDTWNSTEKKLPVGNHLYFRYIYYTYIPMLLLLFKVDIKNMKSKASALGVFAGVGIVLSIVRTSRSVCAGRGNIMDCFLLTCLRSVYIKWPLISNVVAVCVIVVICGGIFLSVISSRHMKKILLGIVFCFQLMTLGYSYYIGCTTSKIHAEQHNLCIEMAKYLEDVGCPVYFIGGKISPEFHVENYTSKNISLLTENNTTFSEETVVVASKVIGYDVIFPKDYISYNEMFDVYICDEKSVIYKKTGN